MRKIAGMHCGPHFWQHVRAERSLHLLQCAGLTLLGCVSRAADLLVARDSLHLCDQNQLQWQIRL